MAIPVRLLVVLAIVIVAAGTAAADDEVALVGSFVWERSDKTLGGELDVVFTPSGTGEWMVAFQFDWEDEPHVFSGTAQGSLTGDLTGNVASDDPGHPLKFEFKGAFLDGKFTGTHGYFNGKGELVDSGTLELAPAG